MPNLARNTLRPNIENPGLVNDTAERSIIANRPSWTLKAYQTSSWKTIEIKVVKFEVSCDASHLLNDQKCLKLDHKHIKVVDKVHKI